MTAGDVLASAELAAELRGLLADKDWHSNGEQYCTAVRLLHVMAENCQPVGNHPLDNERFEKLCKQSLQ
jgi:hypothetical protein